MELLFIAVTLTVFVCLRDRFVKKGVVCNRLIKEEDREVGVLWGQWYGGALRLKT